ncbi:MAG: hypothetical protein FD131_3536 [Rhodocyclaceae bacterium]|nr:MAG: hypothetical protein FD131_3536 [Rhodocyclaceae bacterium]
MGKFETIPLVPEQDSAGCDITQPAPADRRLDATLEQMRKEWHGVARYRIFLTADGDWNDKTVVAEWLPYQEACDIRDKLNVVLLAQNGGVHRWASPSYGISLHLPPVVKGNQACVGDLLLHEVVEPHGEFSLSGVVVVRQFLVPAVVTEVGPGGRIVSFCDRTGGHARAPRNPHVVSASVLDVVGLLASIKAEEARRGHWGGEFITPKAIQHWLVAHQLNQDPTYPVKEAA